jgi:hypothetical protein
MKSLPNPTTFSSTQPATSSWARMAAANQTFYKVSPFFLGLSSEKQNTGFLISWRFPATEFAISLTSY